MQKIAFYTIMGFVLSSFFGCVREKSEFRMWSDKYTNATIHFPNNGRWRILDKDTSVVLHAKARIVAYYNASDCISCRMKELPSWNVLLNEIRHLNLDVEFVAIFKSSPEDDDFVANLARYEFFHPILCDEEGTFEQLNKLPDNPLYHTFLIDQENRVQMIGTPIYNPKLWEEYKRAIHKLNISHN